MTRETKRAIDIVTIQMVKERRFLYGGNRITSPAPSFKLGSVMKTIKPSFHIEDHLDGDAILRRRFKLDDNIY